MAWSTKELADLAGVTLRSIRHWHDVGLLQEPERLSNGYKQYTALHLVLALRIARLTSLGFSLESVAVMLDSEEQRQSSILGLRDELDLRIAELTGVRAELDALISGGISPDLSPEALLAMEALGPTPGSRNGGILLARLLEKDDLPSFTQVMREAGGALARFDAEVLQLPADTPEAEVVALAERGAVLIDDFFTERGDALPQFRLRVDDDVSASAMAAIMREHLNPAQDRVMVLLVERLVRLRGNA